MSDNKLLYQEFDDSEAPRIQKLQNLSMEITRKSQLLNRKNDTNIIELRMDAKKLFLDGRLSSEDIMDLLRSKLGDGLQRTLRGVYKKNSQLLKEEGSSCLYLSVGSIKWFPDNSSATKEKQSTAVIYLCPARVIRDKRGEFYVSVNVKEVFINPVLKVFFRQAFSFDTAKLAEQPSSGTFDREMGYFSFLIEKKDGWILDSDDCSFGIFKVPNQAIWDDLHDDKVINHPIVDGLLSRKMTWENDIDGIEYSKDSCRDIFGLPSDSYQNIIIKTAFDKRAQLIVGPAGNGKSQTIVNIILEAIRHGKSVLFTSEKKSAIDVVGGMLDEAQVGDCILMCVDTKDKEVIAHIKNSIDHIDPFYINDTNINLRDYNDNCKRYDSNYEYLKKYYDWMNNEGESGRNIDELIDIYEKNKDCKYSLVLDEACEEVGLIEAEEILKQYVATIFYSESSVGKYADYLIYDFDDITDLKLEKETKKIIDEYNHLVRKSEDIYEYLALDMSDDDRTKMKRVKLISNVVKECPEFNQPFAKITSSAGMDEKEKRQELIRNIKAVTIKGRIPDVVVDQMRKRMLEEYSLELINDISIGLRQDPDSVISRINNSIFIRNINGKLVIKDDDDSADRYESYLDMVKMRLKDFSDGIIDVVLKESDKYINHERSVLIELCKSYSKNRQAYEENAFRTIKKISKIDYSSNNYPKIPVIELVREWNEFHDQEYNKMKSYADKRVSEEKQTPIGGVISQLEEIRRNVEIKEKDVISAYRCAWAKYYIDKSIDQEFESSQFEHTLFKTKVNGLKESEEEIRKIEIAKILVDYRKNLPDLENGEFNNEQFSKLQQLVRKKDAQLREFFESAGNELLRICPCVIMRPEDVASCIPAGSVEFDLVIIDEGSQMTEHQALVPISRGKRVLIFGDENQLGPNGSFVRSIDEATGERVERDSILQSAYYAGIPKKTLRFHYRSECEGLIAFSNNVYYNNELITFPDSNTFSNGVYYECVEDGVYENKVNVKEADRVWDKICELYAYRTDENATVGVLTLNINQCNLIKKIIDERSVDVSNTDDYVGLSAFVDDYVSVMNLENCQGHEFDHVILSPGFGIDKNGKIPSNFGALTSKDGWRRLNVYLTRAKKSMFVITSIKPHMLDNSTSEGVKGFRDFLKYASGEMTLDNRITDELCREKGIVNNIALELEKCGYEVHTNIGCSSCKVDIGVVNPDYSGEYIIGIIIDHCSERNSIKDKELVYSSCLERKGWKLYRLSKVRWFENSRQEISMIKKEIEKIIKGKRMYEV